MPISRPIQNVGYPISRWLIKREQYTFPQLPTSNSRNLSAKNIFGCPAKGHDIVIYETVVSPDTNTNRKEKRHFI